MNMTDVFNGLGNFFTWSFKIIAALQNVPNVLFWIIIISLIAIWLVMQGRYNQEARDRGTLK